eukprot:11977511-Karenia_brevis.AAC.1
MVQVYWAGYRAFHSKPMGRNHNHWRSVMTWRSEATWEDSKQALHAIDSRNTVGWRRPRPGRSTPWEKPFVDSLGVYWQNKAPETNHREWKLRQDHFVQRWCGTLGLRMHKHETNKTLHGRSAAMCVHIDRAPWLEQWAETEQISLEIWSDSELVMNWTAGRACCQHETQRILLDTIVATMSGLQALGAVVPRHPHLHWCRH